MTGSRRSSRWVALVVVLLLLPACSDDDQQSRLDANARRIAELEAAAAALATTTAAESATASTSTTAQTPTAVGGPGVIEGEIRSESGQGFGPEATVMACPERERWTHPGYGGMCVSFPILPDGTFRMEVEPGGYYLGSVWGWYLDGAVSPTGDAATLVTVEPGSVVSGIEFVVP